MCQGKYTWTTVSMSKVDKTNMTIIYKQVCEKKRIHVNGKITNKGFMCSGGCMYCICSLLLLHDVGLILSKYDIISRYSGCFSVVINVQFSYDP